MIKIIPVASIIEKYPKIEAKLLTISRRKYGVDASLPETVIAKMDGDRIVSVALEQEDLNETPKEPRNSTLSWYCWGDRS